MRVFLILFLSVAFSSAEDVLKVSARDSYLDAYQESKINSISKTNKAEKKSGDVYPVYSASGGDFDGPPFHQHGPPSSQYGPPSSQYGPPIHQYGPPAPQYGPPSPQYGPPPSYGTFAEPVPHYGPPPAYGAPAQNLQVFYGVPHAMIGIWDKLWEKLKWKLDLFTFGKILLKLVIFKKIVSLIAIICLLLFIPALKNKKGLFHQEEENSERGLYPKSVADEKLNNLASFVSEAIRSYTSSANDSLNSTCATTYCRTMKMVAKIGKKNSYKMLAKLYAKENKIE